MKLDHADCRMGLTERAAEVFRAQLERYLEDTHRMLRPTVSHCITPGCVSVESAKCRMYFRVMPSRAVGWGGKTLVICRCDCWAWRGEEYLAFLEFLRNIPGLDYEWIGFEAFDPSEPLLLHSGACPGDFTGNYLLPRARPAVASADGFPSDPAAV